MTDKYQFSYHLSVKTQSYKCWTLSIKTWVAIIKESATNCVYDASEGTGVGIVYLVGKEQDSLFPPQVLLESLAFVGWFHQIQCLQVTYAKAKFINLDANNETKRDQTLTLLESLFFSRKFIQKTILRKEKTSPIFVSINKTVASLIAHTPHIFYF